MVFEVLSEEAITSYICIGKYLKSYDSGIRWNDKELNIKWETNYPIVSDRDSRLMSFREYKENYNESW